MITLNELIKKVDFKKVWQQFINFYPDMAHLKNEYYSNFNGLLLKRSAENVDKMIIHVDKQEFNEDTDKSDEQKIEYRVHGKNNSLEWTGYWDLSANKWEEWLGFNINEKALEDLSIDQITALCLYEMTWFGLSENDVIYRVENLGKDEE